MISHESHNKKRRWPWVLGIVIAGICLFVWAMYQWVQRLSPEKILNTPVVRSYIEGLVGEEHAEFIDILPELFGFSEPQTYLVLLQNNTELRPGGGFIGSYGVIRATNGKFEILDVQGTEALDKQAPASWRVEPPNIIKKELGIDRWYFRDSNWSPDFFTNAKRALEFYGAEGGVARDSIRTVAVLDTTVIEKLLALTGPVTIDGIEFTSSTVVEKLEYDVEYGFEERGIERHERKQILRPFMSTLMNRVMNDFLSRPRTYISLLVQLADEKHILIYSEDQALQQKLGSLNLDGASQSTSTDYLMWVDANLAALKTDYAVQRNVYYTLTTGDDTMVHASSKMIYHHTGGFDWRTTRYRTYARVYVPPESQLEDVVISLPDGVKKVQPSEVDSGSEGGRKWFGVFFVLEPGQEGSITFNYILPPEVRKAIDAGTYTLFVEKQIGTEAHGLTLDLDFDRTITAADPAESEEKWFDTAYQFGTDLRRNRSFQVDLKKEL